MVVGASYKLNKFLWRKKKKKKLINAETAAKMVSELKLDVLSDCELGVCFVRQGGQSSKDAKATPGVYWRFFMVADSRTGERLDSLSYEALLCLLEEAITEVNATSMLHLNAVGALMVRYKCRPLSKSVYQVECTDMRKPTWNRIVLSKYSSDGLTPREGNNRIYAGSIDREDAVHLHTIWQVTDLMAKYYIGHRLRLAKDDLPQPCLSA